MQSEKKSIRKAEYTSQDIATALREVGIREGNNLFIHSNIGFFGKLIGSKDSGDYYLAFKTALFDVVGPKGTVTMPTFSYSFCNRQVFDPSETPGVCGLLTELFRKDPKTLRSWDANFSIAAQGKLAQHYTESPPEHSFGKNSFWDRFYKTEGIVCNFNFDAGSTLVHYIERELKVPYRYDKEFSGILRSKGVETQKRFFHFVHSLDEKGDFANFEKLHRAAIKANVLRQAYLGKGTINAIATHDLYELIKENLGKDIFFLREGSPHHSNSKK